MQRKEVAAYKDEKKRAQSGQHRSKQSYEEVCVCLCVCVSVFRCQILRVSVIALSSASTCH